MLYPEGKEFATSTYSKSVDFFPVIKTEIITVALHVKRFTAVISQGNIMRLFFEGFICYLIHSVYRHVHSDIFTTK